MRRTLTISLLAALLATACGMQPDDSPEVPQSDTAPVAIPPMAETPEPVKKELTVSEMNSRIADIKTSKGTISIRFFPDKAPNHVRNFIDLAENGFYDGVKFHRVIPGFMIQGGDPNTKTTNRGSWGTGGSGTNVKAEFNDRSHKRGIVSMARSGHPDSASSQFFIVVKDSPFLDNQYTVFGEVMSGMEVADAIVAAGAGKENPDQPVAIETVTVRAAEPQ